MKKSKILIIILLCLVILAVLLYAERVKIMTVQHPPVGGFVDFETLGDTTLVDVTIGKKAASSGMIVKLTDDMYLASTTAGSTVTAKDFKINSSMTVEGNVVANSSFNITGSSDFGGNTNFNSGLNVSNDAYVVGEYSATDISGPSIEKGNYAAEFKIGEFKIPYDAPSGYELPLPGSPGSTQWQSVTYAISSGGASHAAGAGALVSYDNWNAQVGACSGDDKYSLMADVTSFCTGQSSGYTCNDYYVTVVDNSQIGPYTTDYTTHGCSQSACNNLAQIGGGCPTFNTAISGLYSDTAYSCWTLCEVRNGGSCSTSELDRFYAYSEGGNAQWGFDSSPYNWEDPVYVNGISYQEGWMKTNQNCAWCTTFSSNTDCDQTYQKIICLPKLGRPYVRTITCNTATVGSTDTIKVLGY